MSKVEIKLNSTEISRQILKSAEMDKFINEKADAIVNRCSGSYEKQEYNGAKRNSVTILTSDRKTYGKNLKSNELLKALRG